MRYPYFTMAPVLGFLESRVGSRRRDCCLVVIVINRVMEQQGGGHARHQPCGDT